MIQAQRSLRIAHRFSIRVDDCPRSLVLSAVHADYFCSPWLSWWVTLHPQAIDLSLSVKSSLQRLL
jgi:hypothetical protein